MSCNSGKTLPSPRPQQCSSRSGKACTGPRAIIEKQSFSSWWFGAIVGAPVLHYHSVMRGKSQNVAPYMVQKLEQNLLNPISNPSYVCRCTSTETDKATKLNKFHCFTPASSAPSCSCSTAGSTCYLTVPKHRELWDVRENHKGFLRWTIVFFRGQ